MTEDKSVLHIDGVDIGFTVRRNTNNSTAYPGGAPPLDEYDCRRCGWHFTGTTCGSWGPLDMSPAEWVRSTLFSHARLCREFYK